MLAKRTIGTARATARYKLLLLKETFTNHQRDPGISLVQSSLAPIEAVLAQAGKLLEHNVRVGDAKRLINSAEIMIAILGIRITLRKLARANKQQYAELQKQLVPLSASANAFFVNLPNRFARMEQGLDEERMGDVKLLLVRYMEEKSALDLPPHI